MEPIKLTLLEPNVVYNVLQWDLVCSKYGNRFLIKAVNAEGDIVQVWSNSKLFNELAALGINKVNFAKMLGISYTFKIIGKGEYNGFKTAKIETRLD